MAESVDPANCSSKSSMERALGGEAAVSSGSAAPEREPLGPRGSGLPPLQDHAASREPQVPVGVRGRRATVSLPPALLTIRCKSLKVLVVPGDSERGSCDCRASRQGVLALRFEAMFLR